MISKNKIPTRTTVAKAPLTPRIKPQSYKYPQLDPRNYPEFILMAHPRSWDVFLDVDDEDENGNPLKGAVLPVLVPFKNIAGINGIGERNKTLDSATFRSALVYQEEVGWRILTSEDVQDYPGYQNGYINEVTTSWADDKGNHYNAYIPLYEQAISDSPQTQIDWNDYRKLIENLVNDGKIEFPSHEAMSEKRREYLNFASYRKTNFGEDEIYLRLTAKIRILDRYLGIEQNEPLERIEKAATTPTRPTRSRKK